MGKKSRDKGARGELACRDELRKVFPELRWERTGPIQRKGGEGFCDVETTSDGEKLVKGPWFVEVKYYAGQHVAGSGLRQAIFETDGRLPLVFTKDTLRPREGWFVSMRLSDFEDLVRGRLRFDFLEKDGSDGAEEDGGED